MARVYWTGGAGNWSDTTKWSPSPPTSDDAVVLPVGAVVKVDLAVAQVGALVLEPGSALSVLTAASLNLNGPAMNHGTMNFSGEVTSHAPGDAVVTGVVPTTILGPVLTWGDAVFTFGTVSNRSYTVEWSATLAPANWQFYTNLTGSGGKMGFATRPSDSSRRYFRVRQA